MQLERVVFFGRTGEESLTMYQLDPAAWRGARVLDCPGGPGSLSALLRRSGIDVTAVDPLYGLDPDALEQRARLDIDRTVAELAANPAIDPRFDPEVCRRQRLDALADFLADRRLHPDRYLEAALPELPFPDGSFDLVLSGHLLFSYSPMASGGLLPEGGFDLDWHRRAVAELLRLATREVRLYPAHTAQGVVERHPFAAVLLAELPEPWTGAFVSPGYEQGHVGCTDGLRLSRRGAASAPGASS